MGRIALIRETCRGLLAVAILLALAADQPAVAQERTAGVGGLLVAPSRITIGPRERTGEVTLVNRSVGTVTYRITLVNKEMTESGLLLSIPDENEEYHSAARFVRFSPRQVTLGPNESQKIRLMLRKPADLAPGEYRSHLQFTPVPDGGASLIAPDSLSSGEQETQIAVVARAGLSIPVIIRHGSTTAVINISDFTLLPPVTEGEGARLSLQLNRLGNRSTYGDIWVERVSAPNGNRELIGILRGVAVYTPNPLRIVEIALNTPGESLSGGQLRVSYSIPGGSKDSLLASSEVMLP